MRMLTVAAMLAGLARIAWVRLTCLYGKLDIRTRYADVYIPAEKTNERK